MAAAPAAAAPIATGLMPARASPPAPRRSARPTSSRQRRSASCSASGRPDSALSALPRLSDELAPQHRGHVGSGCDLKPSTFKQLDQAGHAGLDHVSRRWWCAERRSGPSGVSSWTTLNGTMPATTRCVAEQRCRRRVALPVPFCRLTTVASGGAWRAIELGHLGRVAALDRHQHESGAGEGRGRIGSRRERRRRRAWRSRAVEIGDRAARSAPTASTMRGRRQQRDRRGRPVPGSRRHSSRCCRRRQRRSGSCVEHWAILRPMSARHGAAVNAACRKAFAATMPAADCRRGVTRLALSTIASRP